MDAEDRTQRLSDYLDGELADAERSALERELAADPALAVLLEELRSVRETAAGLPPLPPERDLWPGIAERIGADADVVELAPRREARARRRAVTLTLPQLAAAGLATLLIGGGAAWVALGSGVAGAGPGGVASAPTTSAPGAMQPVAAGVRTPMAYETAVRDLERRLAGERDRLDPETVRVLEESLATIDEAIDRAKAALERDPSNVYLNRHLADARARKLELLRQASALAATT